MRTFLNCLCFLVLSLLSVSCAWEEDVFSWEDFIEYLPGDDWLDDLKNVHFMDPPDKSLPPDKPIFKANNFCGVSYYWQYPVDEAQYVPGSYAGRAFYIDQIHLGEDIALPEGTAVKAISHGRLVHYGPASGYGELVAVVEHQLHAPIPYINSRKELKWANYAMSIYGHLRKSQVRGGTPLNLQIGSCVLPGAVLGYVNDDAHNGDGGVHLHLGLRMQSFDEASRADSAWFRGYDSYFQFGQYYAAASRVIDANFRHISNWHPDGTLIKTRFNPKVYLLKNGKKHWIKTEQAFYSLRYDWGQVLDVSANEMACYPEGAALEYPEPVWFFHPYYMLNRNNGYPDVLYWLKPDEQARRYFFNSVYSMHSWGLRDASLLLGGIYDHAADAFFLNTADSGPAQLRDGTLFVPQSESALGERATLYVMSNGRATRLLNQDMYRAMRYRQPIMVVPDFLLNSLARPSSTIIDEYSLLRCDRRHGSLM